MADLSNYSENLIVNGLLRATNITAPVTVYVALFTAVSDAEAGTGTEVSGGSYARTAVTFGAPSNGATSNSGVVTFPTPSGSWGTVTHWALFDASTSGNALTAIKALTTSQTIASGNPVTIAIGALTFSIA
jgi:hypothetical protein